MLRTGTDAYSGVLDHRGIRAADDMVVMPLQCGTQWDGLGHVFYENYMWNGYDCREVTSAGAQKCGIEKTKNRMVGRGVFLDVPRALGMDILPGRPCDHRRRAGHHRAEAESRAEEEATSSSCAPARWKPSSPPAAGTATPAATRRASRSRRWNGSSAPSSPRWRATPGAARCGRTSREPGINQPWHWITIPIMGMTMGEIFYLKELAEDCAADKVYEFLFVAPALPITGAVGSPTNPLAIK